MINCSIVMRRNPLKKEDPQKAYACAQNNKIMDINDFAEHIASHGCVYSRADIAAVLTLAVDCMRENILNGVLIRLGDLGVFYAAIKCNGANTAAEFRTDVNIVGLSVKWRPGERFANLLPDASFKVVPSRRVAQKIIKAIKAGETVVDFNADETEQNPSAGGNTSTGGNPSTGGNGGGDDIEEL